ncbi:MAG: twin-arginine translocase TatA/TatE family subunit [Candidatus Omnitrophica bacterium]|nr:twin-arginine translocase TatA/TatE family subunit [Candidatus Omnitrophota bacterium]
MNLGWPELILILFICLLLFGANRLPEIAKQMGKAIREFKNTLKDAGKSDD